MTVGVQVWYSEEEFSIDFLPLFMFLYIPPSIFCYFFLSIFLLQNNLFSIKYVVLPYSIEVVPTVLYFIVYSSAVNGTEFNQMLMPQKTLHT